MALTGVRQVRRHSHLNVTTKHGHAHSVRSHVLCNANDTERENLANTCWYRTLSAVACQQLDAAQRDSLLLAAEASAEWDLNGWLMLASHFCRTHFENRRQNDQTPSHEPWFLPPYWHHRRLKTQPLTSVATRSHDASHDSVSIRECSWEMESMHRDLDD